MTRANLCVRTIYGTHHLHWGSDAYPDVVRDFLKLVLDYGEMPAIFWLAEHNPAGALYLGRVGNPYFYYEVDQTKGTIKVWESQRYWVNAPEDWEQKGWNCWTGSNGKYGFHTFRKGKLCEQITTGEQL